MEEWKEYRLGDVCKFQEGYVNPPQGNPEFFDGDIKWLRATDLNDGYIYNTSRTLTELGYMSAKKSAILFEPGSIAISKSGTIGRLGILKDYMCGNRAVINIIPKSFVNTYFIFCMLRSFRHNFPLLAVGSVQKNLYISILEEIKIILPNLSLQTKIASILKSLDDKIEVNRRINDNLEQQAQALFKSWFVDFEPFKDGEFVESELGMIPKGWRVGTLSEIAVITMGVSPSGLSYNTKSEGDVFYQGRAEFGFRFPKRNMYTTEAKRFAEIDSILFSVRAPVGDVNVAEEKCCIGRGLASIKALYGYNSFVLYLMQYLKPFFDKYNSEGTVFGNINKSTLEGFKIIISPKEYQEKFQKIVGKMDCIIKSLEQESSRLSSLRNTLLPRLMSGELKINDISV